MAERDRQYAASAQRIARISPERQTDWKAELKAIRPTTSQLPTLNSLWVGEELTYMERLTMQSALYHGHRFRLYSYDPISVPTGVELCDASEVMPREQLISYAGCRNGVALGSNLWRYHMLAKGLGYWCDLDLVLMKPLDLLQPYVLGWEYEGWINNAVMFAPADSPFVTDLFALTKPNVRPPWFGPRRSIEFYWKQFHTGHLGLEDMPWGTYSAGLVTHIVKTRKLQRFVADPEVFYPLRWSEARLAFGDAEVVERKLGFHTRAVHLWHSRVADLAAAPPPSGSWMARQCERFGVQL